MTYREHLDNARAEYIKRLLKGRTVSEAARVGQINRTHLHKLMSQYGAKSQASRGAHRGNWKGL